MQTPYNLDPRSAPAPWRLFRPILAGASLGDRMLACAGALAGIALTGLICGLFTGKGLHLPLLVAPMGASAVLVFAVPASPLAQPWPTVGGNVISVFIGILIGRLVPEPALAAGLAVGSAILAMSLLRCLHPPGGAAALIGVFGGPAVDSAGLLFPFIPVGLNAVSLVAAGWLFHRISRHSYPHRPPAAPANIRGTADPPPQQRVGVQPADIDELLAEFGETFDISQEDLALLLRELQNRILSRSFGDLTCAEIMSRDVVTVDRRDDPSAARAPLLTRGLRVLPVLDGETVVGTVGLRDLVRPAQHIGEIMASAVTARPEDPALKLVRPLTSGTTHAVIIVDENHRLVGLITQTDLLALLAEGPRPHHRSEGDAS